MRVKNEAFKRAKKNYNRRYYARTTDAKRRYARYTDAEEKLILAHVVSDTELSKIIGRSVRAIQVRRSVLVKGAA